MNNSHFRSLISADETGSNDASSTASKTPMLGSRARSSIPMTPRIVQRYNASNEFARQVADHKRMTEGEPPMKKFKSSAAPKGTKLPEGYQDRTAVRREASSGDESAQDREKRLQALEEMLKLGQIEQDTFDRLRTEIGIGGDLGSTHMVKGLDWKLLQRVRRGENVNERAVNAQNTPVEGDDNVDEDLEQALAKEVKTVERGLPLDGDRASTDDSQPSQVLSRDEILRRWKQNRAKDASQLSAVPEPSLGDRFKKVESRTASPKKRFIETVNGRRREVLLTTDKDGNPKRKLRWLDKESPISPSGTKEHSVGQPLGMEIPQAVLAKQKALLEQQQAEEEDEDIFQGIGHDYDPLAGMGEDSDGEVNPENVISENAEPGRGKAEQRPIDGSKPRNYFSTGRGIQLEEDQKPSAVNDATILAALKRAAALRQTDDTKGNDDGGQAPLASPEQEEDSSKQEKLLEKLRRREQDDAGDLDLGFGESRFGDDDDEEGPVGKSSGRKRGPKKKKGDKDNVGDVMSVLAGR